ncbi:Holliday junction branch migration protein RuvA [bacterium]|nr:Holliday junction branch migration protein RuvA [bacterium]
MLATLPPVHDTEGMIGFLSGTVHHTYDNSVLLNVHGVGYKISVTKETAGRLIHETPASFYTHLAVRENALDLYGFTTPTEQHFFELLLTVSGIGPKSALSILDLAPVETLRSAIAGGNPTYLTNVSGIGKKTAEKIVLELREKVGAAATSAHDGGEALEAMQVLGYSAVEAREALKSVPQHISETKERIRYALKRAGKK